MTIERVIRKMNKSIKLMSKNGGMILSMISISPVNLFTILPNGVLSMNSHIFECNNLKIIFECSCLENYADFPKIAKALRHAKIEEIKRALNII